ncbi:MAG: sodium:proton antiporter, partial [Marivirga sp.]|nr:sodium:proton antiporter [Marivirga sp.]
MEAIVIILFVIGYLLIALEHPVKINKSASAIITGVLCWTVYAV